jgi:hypothetical protein
MAVPHNFDGGARSALPDVAFQHSGNKAEPRNVSVSSLVHPIRRIWHQNELTYISSTHICYRAPNQWTYSLIWITLPLRLATDNTLRRIRENHTAIVSKFARQYRGSILWKNFRCAYTTPCLSCFDYQLNAQFLYSIIISYIIILDMFRAILCSSSGGQIVLLQHLVSPLSVSGRTVHRSRADCSPLSTGALYGVTIPDAVTYNLTSWGWA